MDERQINEQTVQVKKKEKSKDIRSTIILCCTCVMMLGTASYAWFSVSSQPKVTNMALVAGSAGNLKVCDTENGTYSDEVELNQAAMANVVLNPVTTLNGREFFAPVYTEDTVSSVEAVAAADLNTKYVYETVFYIKAEVNNSNTNSRQFDVFLVGDSSSGGSFVSSNKDAASAIRVSLTLGDGTETVIYEPNADASVTGLSATDGVKSTYGLYTTIKQNTDKGFVSGSNNHSEKIFTITENTPYKVTMRVWIEGTDKDCVNEISVSDITGQLQFVSQEVITTN